MLSQKCQMKFSVKFYAIYGSTADWTIESVGLAQSKQAELAECMTTGVNLKRHLK